MLVGGLGCKAPLLWPLSPGLGCAFLGVQRGARPEPSEKPREGECSPALYTLVCEALFTSWLAFPGGSKAVESGDFAHTPDRVARDAHLRSIYLSIYLYF